MSHYDDRNIHEPPKQSTLKDKMEMDSNRLFSYLQSPRPIADHVCEFMESHGIKLGVKQLCKELIIDLEEILQRYSMDVEFLNLKLARFCSFFQHIMCAKELLTNRKVNQVELNSLEECERIIKEYSSGESQRVCSKAFKAGDIVWNCKQCQKDSTCVLCQDCFTNSDHTGHDIYFYHVLSEAGGCCDCGDEGAWDPKGFCTKHQNAGDFETDTDPRQNANPEFCNIVSEVFSVLIPFMARLSKMKRGEFVLRGNPIYSGFEMETKSLIEFFVSRELWNMHVRENTDFTGQPSLLKDWCAALVPNGAGKAAHPTFVIWELTKDNHQKSVDLCIEINTRFHCYRAEVLHPGCVMVSHTMAVLAKWCLEKLCIGSDTISRIATLALTGEEPHFKPLSDMLVCDFSMADAASKNLRNLYLRLLVDSMFKHRFAISFARQYVACARARVNSAPTLEVSDKDALFSLSVQFLNRPSHVEMLVYDHNFLESTLQGIALSMKTCIGQDGTLDLSHPILTHRKIRCIVTDMSYVLSAPGMSSYFLLHDNHRFLSQWLHILSMMYNMHVLTRVVSPYAPRRDDRWITAFNMELCLVSLFTDVIRALVAGEPVSSSEDSLQSISNVSKLILFCTEQMKEFLLRLPSAEPRESRFGNWDYLDFDVSRDPTTLHNAYQRFYGCTYLASLASSFDPNIHKILENRTQESFWVALMSQSLNALIMYAQYEAGMWKRNEDMPNEIMNYQSLPTVPSMHMDIKILQAALCNLSPHSFIYNLITRYGLTEMLNLNNYSSSAISSCAASSHSDTSPGPKPTMVSYGFVQPQRNEMGVIAESFMDVLIWTLTELPSTGFGAFGSDIEKGDKLFDRLIRRALIHHLAVKKRTRSSINEYCSNLKYIYGTVCTAAKTKAILETCAVDVASSDGMGPKELDLLPESWKEFDPCYYRLFRQNRDRARERFMLHRSMNEEALSKTPFFPGDIGRRGNWSTPRPTTSYFADIHPTFLAVRRKIFSSEVFRTMLQCLLQFCISQGEQGGRLSISFLSGILHLTTLHVYFLMYEIDNENETSMNDTNQANEASLLCKGADDESNHSVVGLLMSLLANKDHADSYNTESIRWILWQLCNMSDQCTALCEKLAQKEAKPASANKDKLSRKRKAQRQALLNMKLSQEKASKAFLESFSSCEPSTGDFNSEEAMKKSKLEQEYWEKSNFNESIYSQGTPDQSQVTPCGPECVACHEQYTLDQGTTFFMGYRQHIYTLQSSSQAPLSNKWCVENAKHGVTDYILQLCGHAIHKHCLATYKESIHVNTPGISDGPNREFLCPLCKTLSNIWIPWIPSETIGRQQHSYSNTQTETSSTGCAKWLTSDSKTLVSEAMIQRETCNFEAPIAAIRDDLVSASFLLWEPMITQENLPVFEQAMSELAMQTPPQDIPAIPPVIGVSRSSGGRVMTQHSLSEAVEASMSELAMHTGDSESESPADSFENLILAAAEPVLGYSILADVLGADDVLATRWISRMQRITDTAQACLWLNDGKYMTNLTNHLVQLFATKPISPITSTILRKSPEMLAIMWMFVSSSQQSLLNGLRGLFVVKLVQSVLDYHPEKALTLVDLNEPIPAIAAWANAIRDLIGETSWPAARGFDNMTLVTNHVISYVMEYVHVCQVISALSNRDTEDVRLFSPDALLEDNCKSWIHLPSFCESALLDQELMNIVRHWLSNQSQMQNWKPVCTYSDTPRVRRPLTLKPLFQLKNSYTEQYVAAHHGVCNTCEERAHDRAICLLCGEILVAGKSHPGTKFRHVKPEKGQCTEHTETMHNGIGAVLLFRRSSYVLLINRNLSAYWGSLYVDANGDDQQSLPSLPMYLDALRWSKLHQLYASHSIASTVSSLRNVAQSVIRQNYY